LRSKRGDAPANASTNGTLATQRSAKLNVRYVPVALSSSRPPHGDTEDRLGAYLATVRHMAAKARVIAWRQGQYGLAAVAAGAAGYQTGPGTDERCDLPNFARAGRPKPPPKPGKGPKMTKRIYLGRFGRSVSDQVAEALMKSGYLRGTLTCADIACCPNGVSSHDLRLAGANTPSGRALVS
jgi:hypothetical protein